MDGLCGQLQELRWQGAICQIMMMLPNAHHAPRLLGATMLVKQIVEHNM
jgi:hypothetical protein